MLLDVDTPRLARQTSVSGLVLAAALLCAVMGAGPAEASTSKSKPHSHSHSHAKHHRAGHRAEQRKTADPRQPRSGSGLPAPRVASVAGFDTCSAPSASAMRIWHKNSSYRAVGVYVGGRNRACASGNLTAGWVATVSAQGWSLIPIYVGSQAPCSSQKDVRKMVPAQAAQQGAAEADDAAGHAAALGMVKGSPVYFDLEAFKQTDRGCVNTVVAYLSAWSRELHARGYYSGVYGSAASGMATLTKAVESRSSFTVPDAIWIARWDRQPRTSDGSVPGSMWSHHQRIKQYQGGHVEKHGGVAINIDSDYLDGPVARLR